MAETDQKVWKMEHHGQVSLYETVIFTAERGANPYDGQYRGAGFFAKSRFWEPPCYYRVKFSRLSSVFFRMHARLSEERSSCICRYISIFFPKENFQKCVFVDGSRMFVPSSTRFFQQWPTCCSAHQCIPVEQVPLAPNIL